MILEFRKSINDSSQLRSLYNHCVVDLQLPGEYTDLLRMSVVYCMSALDKLIHDIVIRGMVDIFSGSRESTRKYLNEAVTLQWHMDLINSTVPPAEIVFEGIVRKKISHQSFMDPVKLADALSLVWSEEHKWQVIADAIGEDQKQIKTELRNIFQRRNAIVHEADRNPVTNEKIEILKEDADRIESFVSNLGEAVYSLILGCGDSSINSSVVSTEGETSIEGATEQNSSAVQDDQLVSEGVE